MTIHTGAKTTGVKVSGKAVTTSFTDRRRQRSRRSPPSGCCWRSACAPTSRASASRAWASRSTAASSRSTTTYQTTSPGIWAIGDCAGPPLLAHVAMAEGVRTVEAMAGKHVVADQLRRDPRLHLLRPRGRVDRQDRGAGRGGRASTSPSASSRSASNGKALGAGHTDGFIKVITNKARGEIVGVHAIGHGVTDLIAEMSLAITSEATAHDVLAADPPAPDAVRGHVRGDRRGAGRGRPHLTSGPCRGSRAPREELGQSRARPHLTSGP